jgi:hypothetical protein
VARRYSREDAAATIARACGARCALLDVLQRRLEVELARAIDLAASAGTLAKHAGELVDALENRRVQLDELETARVRGARMNSPVSPIMYGSRSCCFERFLRMARPICRYSSG